MPSGWGVILYDAMPAEKCLLKRVGEANLWQIRGGILLGLVTLSAAKDLAGC